MISIARLLTSQSPSPGLIIQANPAMASAVEALSGIGTFLNVG
ncbi:hypothetical protein [Pectobacterium sp. B1J-3]